jgi:hypothetical protein
VLHEECELAAAADTSLARSSSSSGGGGGVGCHKALCQGSSAGGTAAAGVIISVPTVAAAAVAKDGPLGASEVQAGLLTATPATSSSAAALGKFEHLKPRVVTASSSAAGDERGGRLSLVTDFTVDSQAAIGPGGEEGLSNCSSPSLASPGCKPPKLAAATSSSSLLKFMVS